MLFEKNGLLLVPAELAVLFAGPFSNSPRMVGGGRRGNDDSVDALQGAGEQERAKAKWAR